MKKSVLGALLASSVVAVAGGFVFWPSAHEADGPRPWSKPMQGDYWALRVAYPTMHFSPSWYTDAKIADQQVQSAVPEGDQSGYLSRRSASPLALNPTNWTLLGPKPLLNSGYGRVGGRTNVIVTDPVEPNIAYAASDGGGVWKTTNCCSAGTTWRVTTDHPDIKSPAIGDLYIDPNNRSVLYAGTGDLRFGSFSFGSSGVLKSTDQGETWTVLGEDVFTPFYPPSAPSYPQYQAVGKVITDPNNSATVIAGTKTGIYFSYDGGSNWTGPCLSNSFTTQRQDTTGLLAIDEGSTSTLIAAIGTRGNPTPVQPDLVNNGANGIYRTTIPASGCPVSWTNIAQSANGFTSTTAGAGASIGDGVADTFFGRIELAKAPTAANVLYAMVAHSSASTVLGVWRSSDGGSTWVERALPADIATGGCANATSGGGQMWYDAGLTVDPNNPDVVLLSGVDLWRSTDGADTFVNSTCGYSGGNVHVDHHARAFVGGDSNKVLTGSDGGVYYTENMQVATGRPTFISLNDSKATIELYSGDITANFATSATPGASAGAQDNGSSWVQWTGDPQAAQWTVRNGGDGIYTRIEPVLAQRWYYSSQNGAMVASQTGPNGGLTNTTASTGGTWGGDRLSFVMPFELYRYGVLDAPGSGCTAAAGCQNMLGGTFRVWETLLGGIPRTSWYANSPDLTKNTLGARSFINQLSHAVSDPSVAIAGTNDGNVWMGFGMGRGAAQLATWVNLTASNAVLPNRPIQDVTTDPLTPTKAYAAIGGFDQNTPAQPGHVYEVVCTADCATFTWRNVSSNLPNIPANTILANPNRPTQVFVGTDWGMYFTNDISVASPVWQRFTNGMPRVMIWDMAIDRGFTTLAVFTRGRGAWAWPLPTGPAVTLFADGFE